MCHGHAEAQLVFLQHPPGAAVLPLTPPPPPPRRCAALQALAWQLGLIPADYLSRFAQRG